MNNLILTVSLCSRWCLQWHTSASIFTASRHPHTTLTHKTILLNYPNRNGKIRVADYMNNCISKIQWNCPFIHHFSYYIGNKHILCRFKTKNTKILDFFYFLFLIWSALKFAMLFLGSACVNFGILWILRYSCIGKKIRTKIRSSLIP